MIKIISIFIFKEIINILNTKNEKKLNNYKTIYLILKIMKINQTILNINFYLKTSPNNL